MLKKRQRQKIIIGGAQLGNIYGITNKLKKTQIFEVKKILKLAYQKNILFLDLAFAYGSHVKLKKINLAKFHIIFKFNFDRKEINEKDIKKKVKKVLNNLNLKTIYCIMLHDTMNYNKNDLNIILRTFEHLKKMGVTRKIGFSTYGIDYIDYLVSNYNINIIQTTFNFFDVRILNKKILKKIKKKKIKIHIRSIFLQGILLIDSKFLPKKLNRFKKTLYKWWKFISKEKIKPLDLCMNFSINKNFDKIIIGVNNTKQLKEILKVNYYNNRHLSPLKSNNDIFINPYKWKI